MDGVLAVVLAPHCLACDLALDTPTRGPVCEPCWLSIRPIGPPTCHLCGDALPSWRVLDNGTSLCARCRRLPAGPITMGRSAGEYAAALRQLLHALKYDGRQSLAAPIAVLMRERGSEVLEGADFVVPVPLHWRRRWQRGFNQSEALAAHLGVPVCNALVRTRATRPQFGLPAVQRRRNVRAAFSPARAGWLRAFVIRLREGFRLPSQAAAGSLVKGAVVVLVDDVATTGATLRACAEVLKKMGSREVRTLTAARAPVPRP